MEDKNTSAPRQTQACFGSVTRLAQVERTVATIRADAAHPLHADPRLAEVERLVGEAYTAANEANFKSVSWCVAQIRQRCAALDAEATPKRARKPRRKSTRALIEIANRAGLAVTAVHADGSISTAEPGSGQDDRTNGAGNGEIVL